MLKSALFLILTLVLCGPVVYWAYRSAPPDPRDAALREPGERQAFLTALLVIPPGLFVLAFFGRRWREGESLPVVPRLAAELFLASLLLGVCWLAGRGVKNNSWDTPYFQLYWNVFYESPLYTLPLFGGAVALLLVGTRLPRLARAGLHALVLGLLVLVALAHLVSAKTYYAGHFHFSAAYFPVVAVYQGHALLVDATNMYGLYPHFLNPLFRLIGLSVGNFTAVMGLLSLAGFAAVWLTLCRGLKNRVAAALTLFALVFNGWFSYLLGQGTDIVRDTYDLYFQYYPIRFVFPACVLALAWRYFARPTRSRYWVTTLAAAAAPLWNLDAGVPALLAWLIALAYGELFTGDRLSQLRRILAHAARGSSAFAGAVGLYAGLTHLTYGSWPDLGLLFHYQRIVYMHCLKMLPMPPVGAWVVVVLVYLAGLSYAARALALGQDTGLARGVLLLSILGLGLFSYYQGRSHQFVLKLVCWPCVLLLGVFLDGLISRLRSGGFQPFPCVATALIAWFLAGSTCSLPVHARLLTHIISVNLTAFREHVPPRPEEATLLRRLTTPGEQVVVVSDAEALLHQASGVPTCCRQALSQTILKEDFRTLRAQVESARTKVFIDKASMKCLDVMGLFCPTFIREMQQGSCVLGETARGCLLQKRPLLLDTNLPSRVHLGFQDPFPGKGWDFSPCELPAQATLEVVLQPTAAGGLDGDLVGGIRFVSSPPEQKGVPYCQGLFLLKDGRMWTFPCDLSPGRWHHLAIVLKPQSVSLFLDGVRVACQPAPGPGYKNNKSSPGNSNGPASNQVFNGLIKEVRLLSQALAEAEVVANAKRIQRALGCD